MRSCGKCVACCVYFPVSELDKKAYTPCRMLKERKEMQTDSDGMPLMFPISYRLGTEKNCTSHRTRPAVCSGYFCAWLEGQGEEGDRPDKAGIIFDQNAPEMIIKNAYIAKPLWLGAQDEPEGIRAIENVSRSSKLPILVAEFTERRLLRVVGRGIE